MDFLERTEAGIPGQGGTQAEPLLLAMYGSPRLQIPE